MFIGICDWLSGGICWCMFNGICDWLSGRICWFIFLCGISDWLSGGIIFWIASGMFDLTSGGYFGGCRMHFLIGYLVVYMWFMFDGIFD